MNLLSGLPPIIAQHIPLKQVILQAGIASHAPGLVEGLGKTLVICDENTKDFVKIKGDRIVLPAVQKAELAKAQALAKHSPDYFIAIGSGSLNDIVKYAAYLAGKPYIVFGTAPSMNGYCSTSASLLDNGYKKSYLARPPESVYLDSEILKAAPRRLINSGIGDSICRATVEADAILSSQVKATADYQELFKLLKTEEDKIFDDVEALSKMLIYGGLAMLAAVSSAPASQGEHMLAHYMELMQKNTPQSYHGEQIAVTTLTMAALQQRLLDERDYVEISGIGEAKINAHFGAEFGRYCLQQTQSKYASLTGKKIKLDKSRIEKTIINAETLRKKLQMIGAPVTSADIGWEAGMYDNAVNYSKYTRDRFTFLDLV